MKNEQRLKTAKKFAEKVPQEITNKIKLAIEKAGSAQKLADNLTLLNDVPFNRMTLNRWKNRQNDPGIAGVLMILEYLNDSERFRPLFLAPQEDIEPIPESLRDCVLGGFKLKRLLGKTFVVATCADVKAVPVGQFVITNSLLCKVSSVDSTNITVGVTLSGEVVDICKIDYVVLGEMSPVNFDPESFIG